MQRSPLLSHGAGRINPRADVKRGFHLYVLLGRGTSAGRRGLMAAQSLDLRTRVLIAVTRSYALMNSALVARSAESYASRRLTVSGQEGGTVSNAPER